MKLTSIPLDRPDMVQHVRAEYLRTLVAPMDGMWESTIIAQAAYWQIYDGDQHAGHFCVGPDTTLLRFHPVEAYQAQAMDIFPWLLATHDIHTAIAGTMEPRYFSLCLAYQVRATTHTYLFRDGKRVEPPPSFSDHRFRKMDERDLPDLARFYRANTDGPGAWIEPFLRERLARDELFGMHDQQGLIATGECIPSETQPPAADLGMIVARAQRGRGLGSVMLIHLKQQCDIAGWSPICSCAADNNASKKAIERAGFVSEHRLVAFTFTHDE